MSSPRKALNRPKKRTLVRWDDDLDELLLLTVQSVCNKNNIKIPWAEVATTMGHNVSEGAIVQHLAKVRLRRLEAGKDVPPPLRRGGPGAASKSSNAAIANKAAGGKRRLRNEMASDSPAELVDVIPTSDNVSDEDYVQDRRAKVQTDRTRGKCNMVLRREDQKIKHELDSDQDESDDSSEDSEVIIAPGARFLHYPGDSTLQESPPSTDAGPRKSKIVILKCRPRVQSMEEQLQSQPPETQLPVIQQSPIQQPVSFQGTRQNAINAINTLYQPSYGQYSGQNLLEMDNPITVNMQDMAADYALANNNFNMDLPIVAPENLTSSLLNFTQTQGPTPDSFMNLLTNPHDELMNFDYEAPYQQDMDMDEVWDWVRTNGAQQDAPGPFLGGSKPHGLP
ncbi:uncharacterized protein ACLA_081090 [Aspergillus clavatus NRRL 1]|uniref:Myb-like domain-containing protein n=1 Tax=Aspergillus clavatus (strain ATCC 1007 / CBS 513.65 / DSM 816 / NCTC 3887 / NRRL 1 / QM 1276 / 107) TaxID=344612 RepID=A1CSY8_ASPCL|nr:uncharacterized protein ACLA_081090 [Aspergillus clavatus NRRL 1]EAW06425.1 conserved hypothetical protein [Aspergillus clavatus NRRL 1]